MQYELIVIIPLLAENELKELTDKIGGIVQTAGGVLGENRILARGRLAYSVKKIWQGQHWSLLLDAAPEQLNEIKKQLRLLGNVARFTINKRVKLPPPPPVKEKEIEKLVEARGWTTRSEESAPVSEQAPKEELSPEKTNKASLEELDKKLNEILGGGI